MKVRLFTFLFATVFSTGVFASGFQINENGARAMGLAGAFTGLANDPSAVYFNPAGITQLYGLHFSMGATYIAPSSEFKGPSATSPETTSKLKDQFFTPINFYYTQQLTDKIFIGFSVNNPYGLGTEWEGDWVGKYYTLETEIATFNFAPVVAYKFSDQLSASVGFVYSYADVTIRRKLPTPIPGVDGKLTLEGDDTGFGYRAGVLYKPTDELSLGLSFRSEVEYKMEGDAKTEFDVPVPDALKAAMPKGNISAPLTTPMTLTFGAAYNFSKAFLLSADFQYNGWSSYDKLEITFADWTNPQTNSNVSLSKRDYENSYIARLGAEYVLNNKTTLRGGFLYDKNPVKDEHLDPTLPDADRLGYNIGVGYKLTSYLTLDVAYFYLQFMERDINNSQEFIPLSTTTATPLNGTYNSSAHLIGANLTLAL